MSMAPRKSRAAFGPVAGGIAWRAPSATAVTARTAAMTIGFMEAAMVARSHQCQHARRPTCRAFVFGCTHDDGGARRRDAAEIRDELDPVLAGAEERHVCHEFLGGAHIEAERVDAGAADVAFGDEKLRGGFAESGCVHRAFGVAVEKAIRTR